MTDATAYDVRINVNDKAVQPAFGKLQSAIDSVGRNTGLKTLAAGAEAAQKQMVALGESISAMLGPLAAIGVAMAGLDWFKNAATGAVDFGQQLYLASRQTGVAADQLAKFHYIGKAANVDVQEMDKALYRLNLTAQKAAVGMNKPAAAMFSNFKIPLTVHGRMRGLTDIFGDLANAVRTHPALAQLIAGTAFGSRGAQSMLPILMGGREEITKMGADFEQAYGKITPASVDAAHAAHEAWEQFDLAIDGLQYRLGAMLAPGLTFITKQATAFLTISEQFASKVPGWLSAEFRLTSGDVSAAGASFASLGTAMDSVWDATGPLRDSIGDLLDAMDPSIPNEFDQAMQHLPKSLRDAAPAVNDFLSMFRGDVGASLRNLTRILNLMAATLREVALVSKWAASQLAVFHGKSINLSLPSGGQFSAAWQGKPIPKLKSAGTDQEDKYGVWDYKHWLDFPSSSSGPRGASSGGGDSVWDWHNWFHSSSPRTPIGIRLNNPTDLRSWGNMPIEQTGSGPFARFPSMEAGISAGAGNLLAYGRHGWNTLDQIISHWAPSSENNTSAYIGDVSRHTGFGADQTLNLRDPHTVELLLGAMALHETGRSLLPSLVAAGVGDRFGTGSTPRPGKVSVDVNVHGPRGTTMRVRDERGDTISELNTGQSWEVP